MPAVLQQFVTPRGRAQSARAAWPCWNRPPRNIRKRGQHDETDSRRNAGRGALALTVAAGSAAQAAGANAFVGSEKCGTCHVAEYGTWKNSLHAKMVRPVGEGILKDARDNWWTDGTNPGPSKVNLTGAPARLEDVVFVVGSY